MASLTDSKLSPVNADMTANGEWRVCPSSGRRGGMSAKWVIEEAMVRRRRRRKERRGRRGKEAIQRGREGSEEEDEKVGRAERNPCHDRFLRFMLTGGPRRKRRRRRRQEREGGNKAEVRSKSLRTRGKRGMGE